MRPSRFIANTDYNTAQNDDNKVISITIPSQFEIPFGSTSVPFSQTESVGKKSAGMQVSFSSSKYPGKRLLSSIIAIPCQRTYQTPDGEVTDSAMLHCWAYRSAPGQVTMEIIGEYPGSWTSGNMRIFDCGQTIECHVSTFLSPFEL